MFIALEGAEGVGKSTQARWLSDWLTARGVDHTLAREPGGTKAGEAIRALVLERLDLGFTPVTELFLILASRSEFVAEIARPALESGKALVADRFSLSTLVYQGCARGIDLQTVKAGLEIATGGLEPDLYVVLDLPPRLAHRRQRARGKTDDRIEGAGRTFMDVVHRSYRELARSLPNVVLVDGSGTRRQVHEGIVDRVSEHFGI